MCISSAYKFSKNGCRQQTVNCSYSNTSPPAYTPFPRMRTLVTIGTPHQGIFGLPKCTNSDVFDECTLIRDFLSQGAIEKITGIEIQDSFKQP